MPLVRVSLRRGKSDDYKKAIGDGVYKAMREAFNVPEEDRFVVVSEHSESEFQFSKTYLDIARSDDLVIIQITANNTRTTEQKKRCSPESRSCCRSIPACARKTYSSAWSTYPRKTGRSAMASPSMHDTTPKGDQLPSSARGEGKKAKSE